MAVSFKVPKSPSRDIALTDTFMGVDLTNTGANIDGYRSPHAPNMVRNVPGKVRKRMGYYKEILFGRDVNVNYAKDTSAQEKEIHITESQISTPITVYETFKPITSKDGEDYTLYLEFDYTSEEDFTIMGNEVEAAQPDEEGNWPHYSDTVSCASTDEITEVDLISAEKQDVYIKNFSLMRGKDESYEWSPAPKYFVERETNDPVYGCHFLRRGGDDFEGDRVSGVNRALKTSIAKDIDRNNNNTLIDLYQLGEIPGDGVEVYVYFNYSLSRRYGPTASANKGYIYVAGNQQAIEVSEGSGTVRTHFTMHRTSAVNDKVRALALFNGSSASYYPHFHISKFAVTYNKFVGYNGAWAAAPEDNKEDFHLDEMYKYDKKNYAAVEAVQEDSTSFSTTKTLNYDIGSGVSHIEDGLTCVSFIANTSDTAGKLTDVSIELKTSDETTVVARIERKAHFKKEKFNIFLRNFDTDYVKRMSITFNVSANTKAHVYFTEIKIRKYEIRSSFYFTSKYFLYHVGKDFYLHPDNSGQFEKVYENANEHISQSFQINDNSYIIDGSDIYEFTIAEGEGVRSIGQDFAYIPTVTKAREYNGGGVGYEALNLLQPGFIEQFIGVAGERTYQLSFQDLDDTKCTAWILDSNGNWNIKEEDVDFSVDRILGKVTFNTAPGVTPLEGQDSIKIQAYRTVEGYRDRIVKCTFGTLYGVSGAADRIFLSGNPDHPNWDFYSQYKDATYYPDTGYSVLGSSQSAIKGYAIVSNYLATFKDGFDPSQSVFVREGDMLVVDEENKTSEPVFKLINSLQGEGVVSPYSFGYLQTEPVFLTKAGIYAITEQDITGEKYSQNRSFYLDGQLRKEENLSTAFATVHDNQYILALNGKLYVLDGLQATRTDKSEPYATRQYAGFYCTDIPALTMWEDDAVCFGTEDGKVCRFYTDVEALESYNDDGKPIYSCWETPDLDGKLFYKNKTFRYMAVRLMQAVKTSVKLYSRRFGLWTLNAETAWNLIKEQTTISNMLDFENLDFNLLSFSADLSERLVHTKLRVKKVDKARFRVENGELNEPFGLFDLALEYIESGNYKG